MEKYCIALSKFLSRFVSLEGYNLTKMTHKDVAVLLPHLKTLPNEVAKDDPSLLSTGKVVFVYDGKTTLLYEIPKQPDEEINLFEVYRFQEEPNIKPKTKSKTKVKPKTKTTDYTELSDYELRSLLRKKFNTQEVINEVNKEIKRRERKEKSKKLLKKVKKNEEY